MLTLAGHLLPKTIYNLEWEKKDSFGLTAGDEKNFCIRSGSKTWCKACFLIFVQELIESTVLTRTRKLTKHDGIAQLLCVLFAYGHPKQHLLLLLPVASRDRHE